MRHSLRTFAAAASIAAAGLAGAGTAAAAPVQLTEAAPIQGTDTDPGAGTGTDPVTGSAALLPVLLPLLAGSSEAPNVEQTADTGTGSAETLLPLLASLSAAAPE